MGGGGGHSTIAVPQPERINEYERNLNAWASQLWSDTQPSRSAFAHQYFEPVLQGNYNPQTLPSFAPQYDLLRNSLEGQYNQAKGNVLANTPRGGAMTDALTSLENERAKQTGLGTSNLSSNILNDIWNKAYNAAWVTAPPQALSAEAQAAQMVNDMAKFYINSNMQAQQANAMLDQAAQQGKMSGLGALGSGIGQIGGLIAAPFTGGASLFGTGLSGLSSGVGGLAGKGGSQGVTSGLGGYNALMNQAMTGWR